MWAGKYDAVEETLNPLYDQMSNHVMIQRKRLGGDMAIAQAVFSRKQRDKLRKIIGPDLVFIVLNMTKECQMKRIKGRHGDSPMLEEFMRVLVKYAEMCEPAGDDEENAFNVTISEDMSKDDVVKKVLEVVPEDDQPKGSTVPKLPKLDNNGLNHNNHPPKRPQLAKVHKHLESVDFEDQDKIFVVEVS